MLEAVANCVVEVLLVLRGEQRSGRTSNLRSLRLILVCALYYQNRALRMILVALFILEIVIMFVCTILEAVSFSIKIPLSVYIASWCAPNPAFESQRYF